MSSFSKVMKQKFLRSCLTLSYGCSTPAMAPYCSKNSRISSSDNSGLSLLMWTFPCLACAFFTATFLPFTTWSPALTALSSEATSLKTMKQNPLLLPVCWSATDCQVFTNLNCSQNSFFVVIKVTRFGGFSISHFKGHSRAIDI